MRRSLLHRGAALAALAIAACGEDKPPPPPPTAAAAAKADDKAKGAETAEKKDNYMYSAVGKRDPFRPFFVDKQLEDEERAKQDKQLTELQRLAIDQLKLVAILAGTSQPQAMFEDPTGMGHVVTLGTKIGKNGGHVAKIKNDEVVIMEEMHDPTGKKILSPLTVRLPGDELEKK